MSCTKELERACACQTGPSPADLITVLPAANAEHRAHPSCQLPSSWEFLPKGPIRNGSSTTHCPASHKWQTMQKQPHLEECGLGPSISTNFQRYPASKQVTQSGTHSRSSVLGRHSSSVPISKDTAEPTLMITSNLVLLDGAAFKHLIWTNFLLPRLFKQAFIEFKQLLQSGRIRTWRGSSFLEARCGHFITHFQPCQEGNTTPSPQLAQSCQRKRHEDPTSTNWYSSWMHSSLPIFS